MNSELVNILKNNENAYSLAEEINNEYELLEYNKLSNMLDHNDHEYEVAENELSEFLNKTTCINGTEYSNKDIVSVFNFYLD